MVDDLRRWAETVPTEEIPDALSTIEGVRAVLWSRLVTPPTSANGNGRESDHDLTLTPDDVAARLSVTKRWVYRHREELGGRRLSHRRLRFSEAGIRRYLARQGSS